jgi:hypothetical protein
MLGNDIYIFYRSSLTVRDVPCGHANTVPKLLITENTIGSQVPLLKYRVKTIRQHNLESDSMSNKGEGRRKCTHKRPGEHQSKPGIEL